MLYILLIIIIVLQIVFYIKIKNYIEIEFIKLHNGMLLETKTKVEDIYRDMTKRGLVGSDTEPNNHK